MRLLELFSGTHSIAKEFPDAEVISVDLDNKFNPTHNVDILDFDYKQYPSNHFDYIHASPPCIIYSQNQVSWYGRRKRHNITGEMVDWNREVHNECMELSDNLVKKSIEIIKYFKPKYWTLENPNHNNWNNIKYRDFMKEYEYAECNYCMYEYPISKPTLFFNNFNLKLEKCDRNHQHIPWEKFSKNIYERYKIPQKLVREIKRQLTFIEE